MSSIERAMDKLDGAVSDTPADGATTQAADAEASTGAGGAAKQQSAAPEQAPAVAPIELPAEERKAEAHERPGEAAAKAGGNAAAPEPRVRPAVSGSGNFVPLNLERMAAGGFLIPGQSTSREAEEFQRIKRRLLGNLVPEVYQSSRPANLILVTSSVPGEGKTFTSVNLAISITAEIDHTVLAIDTDIVKRDLSKVFGVVDRPGLFDLLADPKLQMSDLLVRTSIPNLTILPAGRKHGNSTEMLASLRMQELTDEIAERYSDRIILFDSPPVLAMTTAAALAPLVGQLILVAEAGSTKHETIKEAILRLDNARITGVILNKSKQAFAPGYDYYGSYYQAR